MNLLTGRSRATGDGARDPRSVGRGLLDFPAARRWLALIDDVERSGAYTFQRSLDGRCGPRVRIDGSTYLMLSAYDYLGLVGDARIEAAAVEATRRYGTGTGGVRLLTGTCDAHRRLERAIAAFKGTPAALTFSSGYVANVAALSALLGPRDVVVADRYAHRSILDGCRLSGAVLRRFRHNDVASLREALAARAPSGRTLVVVEGVYSMDGDVCPLPDIVEVAHRSGAWVYVDEAHSLGTLGARGRGVHEHFGLPPDAVDVWMGCLSKAIPANGGYVAGSEDLVAYLQHGGAPFMFSAALPPPTAAAATAALAVVEGEPERVSRMGANADRLREGLRRLDYDTGTSSSAVIPVRCGDRAATLALARDLWASGIAVAAVTHPAVPCGESRLRLCATAAMASGDVDEALDAFARLRARPVRALAGSSRPGAAASSGLHVETADDIDEIAAAEWDSVLEPEDLLATHRFVRTCQRAGFEAGPYRYVVVRRGNRVVATASFCRMDVRLDLLVGPRVPASVALLRRAWPAALRAGMVVGGLPVSFGTSCLRVRSGEAVEAVLPHVLAAAEAFADASDAALVCFKEFTSAEMARLAPVAAAGYVPAASLPGCAVTLPWPTWEAYLDALRAPYRRQVRQSLSRRERTGLRVRVTSGLALEPERMTALYSQTFERATHRLERLNTEFFRLLGHQMSDGLQTVTVERDGRVLSAGLTLRQGDRMRFLLVGMDYPEAPRCDAYVHLVTEIVAEAIRAGVRRLDFGQTAYDLKLRLGGRAYPLSILLRHRSALLHRAMRSLSRKLFPVWSPPPRRALRAAASMTDPGDTVS